MAYDGPRHYPIGMLGGAQGNRGNSRAIALLPASRVQELRYLMPVMFAAARQIQEQVPNVRFWIPLSMERYRQTIEAAIQQYGLRAELVAGQTQAVLGAADFALTKSGTANLELALRAEALPLLLDATQRQTVLAG